MSSPYAANLLPFVLFVGISGCQGCPVRDAADLAAATDAHNRVEAAEKEHREHNVTPAEGKRLYDEGVRQTKESNEPRFIDRSDYRASPDDTCDPATEDRPALKRVILTVGPHGTLWHFPPHGAAELEIPPGALDETVEIIAVIYDSGESDHPFEYAVLPIGVNLKKPALLKVPAPREAAAEHHFLPVGHGEYRDTTSLYNPSGHFEVITLNQL